MPKVARIGDTFDDTDTIATGSGDVFVNNLPVARLTDMTMGHSYPPPHNFYPPIHIDSGSGSVFVNNLPIARVDDTHASHCDAGHPAPDCHIGTIVTGSDDVFADS